LIGTLDDSDLCGQLRGRLLQAYPADHQVTVLSGLEAELPALQDVPLGQLDRALCKGVSLLYLPPMDCPSSMETFQATVAHLRAPDGCPWDREQTHKSLRKGFLEEAYEVLDALDEGDLELLKEELGDVLLHIVLQAQIGSERGEFSLSDVVCHINNKIIYRHPHVFSGLAVDGVDQVLDNWEALKRKEKGRERASTAFFDGIPQALPALARTQALLRRAEKREADRGEPGTLAGRVGQDLRRWAVQEDGAVKTQMLGNLLFDLVAIATAAGLDAEGALRDANARYERRVLAGAREQLSSAVSQN
jgi:tetrapyrrole methylase family protein/MazG family protein